MNQKLIILAVDPGTYVAGVCIFEVLNLNINFNNINKFIKFKYLSFIKFKTNQGISNKLIEFYKKIKQLILESKVNIIVCEDIFFYKNFKTTIRLAQIQTILHILKEEFNIKLYFFKPKEVKNFISGNGNSSKEQIKLFITTFLKNSICFLKTTPTDVFDSISIGLYGCEYINSQNITKNIC